MRNIAKSIRIEPVFDHPEFVRTMFERNAPYRTMADYLPTKSREGADLPYFRGNWAAGGEPLVDGAETILHNPRFIDTARALFGTSRIRPKFIVVNLNAPMPPGPTHVDIPTFLGATRDQYPLRFLQAMGASELFEQWRVIQAGAVCWFYDGPGGNFEYWPEGLDGPMRTERAPFHNVAIMADNDRMYHRIGRVGPPDAKLPRMSAAAQLHLVGDGTWAIVENGETRATYPSSAMRLSLVWKGDLETEASVESLVLDRVMSIFIADLRQRNIDFPIPADPLSHSEWMALLGRIYCPPLGPENVKEPKEGR
jgi:hypothetical protein